MTDIVVREQALSIRERVPSRQSTCAHAHHSCDLRLTTQHHWSHLRDPQRYIARAPDSILHHGWCNEKILVRLHLLSCQNVPLCVLVSVPFRGVVKPHRELFHRWAVLPLLQFSPRSNWRRSIAISGTIPPQAACCRGTCIFLLLFCNAWLRRRFQRTSMEFKEDQECHSSRCRPPF